MPTFEVENIEINYIVEGSGPQSCWSTGFASSGIEGNWRATGVIDALVAHTRSSPSTAAATAQRKAAQPRRSAVRSWPTTSSNSSKPHSK